MKVLADPLKQQKHCFLRRWDTQENVKHVKNDSFFIAENKVNFEVTDFEDSIKVIYEGLLPDLFKEGKGIVVLGKYKDGIFYADEVFAKHDENYMPPNLELN